MGKEVICAYYPWFGRPDVVNPTAKRWNGTTWVDNSAGPVAQGNWGNWVTGNHPTGAGWTGAAGDNPPDDIASPFYPALGAYSSSDPAVVDQHMAWIKQAGHTVVNYSWWFAGGQSYASAENGRVPIVMDAAQKYGLKVCFDLNADQWPGQVAKMVEVIHYIIDNYGSHPAFWRHSRATEYGNTSTPRPVFTIWDYKTAKGVLSPTQWAVAFAAAMDTLHADSTYNSIVMGLLTSALATDVTDWHLDGLYSYGGNPTYAQGYGRIKDTYDGIGTRGAIVSFTAYTGSDQTRIKTGVPVEAHYNWDPVLSPNYTFDKTWDQCIAFDPAQNSGHGGQAEMVMTTFNEFGEGHVLEPVVFHQDPGSSYTYRRNQDFPGGYPSVFLDKCAVKAATFLTAGPQPPQVHLLAPTAGAAVGQLAPASFTVPVGNQESGGNIQYYNGWYYCVVKVAWEPRVRMAKVRKLSELSEIISTDAGKQAIPVIFDGLSVGLPWIQFPVYMYFVRGRWFIYMNAATTGNGDLPPNNPAFSPTPVLSDRFYVLECTSDDPTTPGSWIFRGKLRNNPDPNPSGAPDQGWTIGWVPFELGGNLFMVTSNKVGHAAGTFHGLAIAQMSDPRTLLPGGWHVLTDATGPTSYSWEGDLRPQPTGPPLLVSLDEVDAALFHNGKQHLLFSTKDVSSPDYCSGLLSLTAPDFAPFKVLDRNFWTKKSTPFLDRAGTPFFRTGQVFTFKGGDFITDYLGYTYNLVSASGPRQANVIPISWTAGNDPTRGALPAIGAVVAEPVGTGVTRVQLTASTTPGNSDAGSVVTGVTFHVVGPSGYSQSFPAVGPFLGWNYTWDIMGLPSGSYQVNVDATNVAGQSTLLTPINLTVNNYQKATSTVRPASRLKWYPQGLVVGATNDRATVYLPRLASSNAPVLISCHGGAGNAKAGWDPPVRGLQLLYGALASAGIIIITPDIGDYTLGAGPGSGPGNWGSDQACDRLEAYRLTAASLGGSTAPITLMGISMGAYTALRYAYRYRANVGAIITWNPAIDPQQFRVHRNDADKNPPVSPFNIYGGWGGLASGFESAWGLGPSSVLPAGADLYTRAELVGLPWRNFYSDNDPFVPVDFVTRMNTHIGVSAQSTLLPGAFHFCYIEPFIDAQLDDVASFIFDHTQ